MNTSSNTKTGVFVNRDDLQQYLYEVSQIPTMTDQELEEAMENIRAQRPDQQETRQRLAERHLWLVVPIARKHRHHFQTMSLLDLIQEGNIALLIAAHNYQGMGLFPNYATRYIKTSMLQAIPKDGTIQIKKSLYFQERSAGRANELDRRYTISLDNESARTDGAFATSLPNLQANPARSTTRTRKASRSSSSCATWTSGKQPSLGYGTASTILPIPNQQPPRDSAPPRQPPGR